VRELQRREDRDEREEMRRRGGTVIKEEGLKWEEGGREVEKWGGSWAEGGLEEGKGVEKREGSWAEGGLEEGRGLRWGEGGLRRGGVKARGKSQSLVMRARRAYNYPCNFCPSTCIRTALIPISSDKIAVWEGPTWPLTAIGLL
jgi:hypothetical protein